MWFAGTGRRCECDFAGALAVEPLSREGRRANYGRQSIMCPLYVTWAVLVTEYPFRTLSALTVHDWRSQEGTGRRIFPDVTTRVCHTIVFVSLNIIV